MAAHITPDAWPVVFDESPDLNPPRRLSSVSQRLSPETRACPEVRTLHPHSHSVRHAQEQRQQSPEPSADCRMSVSRTCDMGMGACVGERGSRVRGRVRIAGAHQDARHQGFRCSLTSNRRLVSIRSTETGLLCALAHQSAPNTVALRLQDIEILDDPVHERSGVLDSSFFLFFQYRFYCEQIYRESNPGMITL